jgi:hypothetical protein
MFYALDGVSGSRNLDNVSGADQYSAQWMNGKREHFNCCWSDYDEKNNLL